MSSINKKSPSSRACLNCRNKHLKCDGNLPVCNRCSSSGERCVYIPSRRGQRRNKTNLVGDKSTSCDIVNVPTPSDTTFFTLELEQLANSQTQTIVTDESPSIPLSSADNVDEEKLIEAYYQYLHAAHPFLLPRKSYIRDRTVFPSHLRSSICFIASHYTSENADKYRRSSSCIFNATTPDDGFKVQSLILLTLAFYARFERDMGYQTLTLALDTASRIGLDSCSFGLYEDAISQESWRRTWWELYIITGLVSLVAGTDMRLDCPRMMLLPTHDALYNDCKVALTRTAGEMRDRFMDEHSFDWSSSAYRIEAMRILTNTVGVSNVAPESQCDAVATSISGFLLSVPPKRRQGLREDGDIDETMSCSLMIIHLASICLHFPRSGVIGVQGIRTVCGTDRGNLAVDDDRTHHSAALRSANAVSKLVASRTTMKTLSPCFACSIAFASVVQLSEYLLPNSSQSEYMKEHIHFELSALNSLGEIWPIARVVRGQIAQFSREAFESSRDESITSGLLAEQWLQDLSYQDFAILPQL